MKTFLKVLVVGLAAALAPFPALSAGKVTLSPLSGGEAIGSAERKAATDGLTGVTAYPDQSFAVAVDGRPAATLVIARADSREVPNASICFLAYAPTGAAAPTILPTIGSGDYEATSCNGVEAVATGTGKDGATRLIVLFQSQSPNTSLIEPVVFDLGPDGGGLTLDAARSSAASTAGATTVKEVRAAIAK